MAINQFQQPIDYSMDVKSPFESALSGVQIGANLAQLQQQQKQQQQQLQQQQAAQNQQVELQKLLSNPNASTQDLLKASALLPKDQSEAVRSVVDKMTTSQQQQQLKQSGQVYAAMQSGNTEVAKDLLKQSAAAYRNSGKEDEAKAAETYIQLIDTNPAGAKTTVGLMMALLPGGDKALENIDKTLSTQRAEALQPSALRKGEAEATQKEVQATNEQKVINADLAKKYAEIGLSKAQASQAVAQSNKLNNEGKILKLDFQAALQGLPLPSKAGTTTVAAATEDERKAQGWLNQATNAYQNMLNSMYTKTGKPTGAEKAEFIESLPLVGGMVGGFTRSTDREKFRQASSSLSEALLRAATGAGVNKDEAEQKLQELTPLYTDDEATRKQKLEAIPMYLQSLQSRAGRAATPNYKVPTAPAAGQRNVTVDY